jgi:hypothetical protein
MWIFSGEATSMMPKMQLDMVPSCKISYTTGGLHYSPNDNLLHTTYRFPIVL